MVSIMEPRLLDLRATHLLLVQVHLVSVGKRSNALLISLVNSAAHHHVLLERGLLHVLGVGVSVGVALSHLQLLLIHLPQ